MAAYSLGVFLATLSPNSNVAMTIAPLINVMLMVVGGFYLNLKNMPSWISWLQYISYIQYAFSAVITDQLSGETFDCDSPNGCTYGNDLLQDLGIPTSISVGESFLCIMVLMVGWRAVAYLYLLYGPTKPRSAV